MTTMERMKNDVVAFYKEKLKTESKDTALNQTLKRFWKDVGVFYKIQRSMIL